MNGEPAHPAQPAPPLLIALVLLALAAWFLATSDRSHVPRPGAALVAQSDISTAPPRTPLGDPPWIVSGGHRFQCRECHRLLDPPEAAARRLTQHRDIVLEHGLNDQCLNCHDRRDRNSLVLRTGETVGFAEAPLLCAQCHGTTWRDWQQGTHGRTNGYWDATRGPLRRLSCIECHDPHAPAFAPMRALPAPQTLRMGTPHPAAEGEGLGRHNPLRQWSLPVEDGPGPEPEVP